MNHSDGTPTFADRESNQSFQPRSPAGTPPADMAPATRTPLADATGETAELGRVAAAVENEQLVRRQLALWNTRDFDAMEAAAAEDVEVVLVPFGTTLHGRRTFRDHGAGWAAAFPDGRCEITRIVADATGAAVEFIGRGTHTGPLVGPAGTIAPTGRSMELRLCYVYEIDGGQIRGVREYYDTGSLMRGLGLVT